MIVCISVFLLTPFLLFSQGPTEEEMLTSIDLGIEWMVNQQNADGSWEYWESVAHTGFALTKLCDYAYEQNPPLSPFDEEYVYSANVIAGFNFLFSHAKAYSPEFGIYILEGSDPHHETYNTAMALMALASSYAPAMLINSENSLVNGLTFAQLVDQIVIYFEWSQNDYNPPYNFGGWGYYANNWPSDNSHTGYVVLALSYAEAFGSIISQDIKNKLTLWIDFIQNDDSQHPDNLYGGSGYSNPDHWVTSLKTGNLLFEMSFCGDTLETTRVQDALGFLATHWDDPSYGPNGPNDPPGQPIAEYDYGWQEHLQAMFCLMKGFESLSIDVIEVDGIDRNWFAEFTTYIVGAQQADGRWPSDIGTYWGWNDLLNTYWALFVLEKVTSIPAPVVFVDFDIHPTSWPNPINTNSGGLTPTAILGTEEFDITTIDPTSLLLEGVPPLFWSIEDVTIPAREGYCNVAEEGPDGYADLTVKYKTQELVAALGDVFDGEELTLTITGSLLDGSQIIKAYDCIIINSNKNLEKGFSDSPHNFNLSQNYPNPFNSSTSIKFQLPKDTHVILRVYDILGNEITTLVNQEFSTGDHLVEFDASNLASGLYYYKLYTVDYTDAKQMLVTE